MPPAGYPARAPPCDTAGIGQETRQTSCNSVKQRQPQQAFPPPHGTAHSLSYERSDARAPQQRRHGDPRQTLREGPPPPVEGAPPRTVLSKAQRYARAAQLARLQEQAEQALSSPRTGPPVARARSSKQRAALVARRKQRVVTPQMVARRPIETRSNIMMGSKHEPADGGSARCSDGGCSKNDGSSVAGESVGTDVTEQVSLGLTTTVWIILPLERPRKTTAESKAVAFSGVAEFFSVNFSGRQSSLIRSTDKARVLHEIKCVKSRRICGEKRVTTRSWLASGLANTPLF